MWSKRWPETVSANGDGDGEADGRGKSEADAAKKAQKKAAKAAPRKKAEPEVVEKNTPRDLFDYVLAKGARNTPCSATKAWAK